LPVESTVGYGVGDVILIQGGGNSETGIIASIGSMVLTAGLANSYPANSTVSSAPEASAPTPSPTGAPSPPSTAVGDPHVTNLIGDSFDVNQPGEHVLLRLPIDESVPPQFELRAMMRPAPASPCGLWITEVILGGEWVGAGEIRVHTSTVAATGNTSDRFALLSGLGGSPAAPVWKPWADFGKDVNVALSSCVTVRSTFQAFQGAVAVRNRRTFEFLVGPAPALDQRFSIVVAQMARRAALDVQATCLGRLRGSARFGGLLGTEKPDPAVEELSKECAAHQRNSSTTRARGTWRDLEADSVHVQLYQFSGRVASSRLSASW